MPFLHNNIVPRRDWTRWWRGDMVSVMKKTRSLSLIVPVYNEEGNLGALHAEIKALYNRYDIETIFVDDGSKDTSVAELRRIVKTDSRAKLIIFARNYGQTAAIGAGVAAAAGEVIIPLDADLQNDPADIPRLIEKFDEGYDIVSGWRKDRHDGYLRVLLSRIANGFIARTTGVPLHDYGCTLKAYRATILKQLDFFGEMHRFIPAYASWQGARVTEIKVNHRARVRGASKYGFSRIGKVLLDLIVVKYVLSFGQKPIYFFGFLGAVSGFLGVLSLVAAVVLRFAYGISLIQTPLVLLSALLIIVSVQMVSLGIVADVVIRTRRPEEKRSYVIRERVNLG